MPRSRIDTPDYEAITPPTRSPRPCFLAGCTTGCWGDSMFCSADHGAAWEALPVFVQGPCGMSLLTHRGDLDLTLALSRRDAEALTAFTAAYEAVYGDPVERLAAMARASRAAGEGGE